MIISEAKKKIEASSTITNTMMVVIVVSRRVGQVTLAVSERTSCRNLNGLKAIAGVIRVVGRLTISRNPNSPLAPSPLLKDEPASGLDCSGDFKAAPDIRQNGPAAGGGYVLRTGPKVKMRGIARRTSRNPIRQNQGLSRKDRSGLAGAAGLEPATTGFGDRCSTN